MPILILGDGTQKKVGYLEGVGIGATLHCDENRLKSFSDEDRKKFMAIALNVQSIEWDPKKTTRPWETRKLGGNRNVE